MKSVTRVYGSTVDAINFVVGRPDAPYLPWSSVGFGPFHAPTAKNPTHLGAGLLNDTHRGVLCVVRQPAALARRAGGPIALRPHLSIGLPLRSLLYNRAWLIHLLPPHTIYLYYTRKVMEVK